MNILEIQLACDNSTENESLLTSNKLKFPVCDYKLLLYKGEWPKIQQ